MAKHAFERSVEQRGVKYCIITPTMDNLRTMPSSPIAMRNDRACHTVGSTLTSRMALQSIA